MPIKHIARNWTLLAALAAVYPGIALGAGVARVDFAVGKVAAVAGDGVQRPLAKGAEIAPGEIISTGEDGRAQLRFSDGALVSLQPRTDFRIDEYHFADRNDGQEKGFFSLLRGGLRTITGLIGKSNRDSYRVTTRVATIGIRGTGYSVVYTDAANEAIIVHTGEGKIGVCNVAGCIDVASGESAFVGGSKVQPKLTAERPLLKPAQPLEAIRVDYAVGENRALVHSFSPPPTPPTPLLSGPGYAISHVGMVSGSPSSPNTSLGVNATFGNASELQSFQVPTFSVPGSYNYQAKTIAGSFAAGGVIGWGRWASGTLTDPYGPVYSLANYHYVAGQPTSSSDIAALQAANFSATYNLIGFTFPTSQTGVVGQAPSGTLMAKFNSTSISVGVNLSVPIGSSTFSVGNAGVGTSNGVFYTYPYPYSPGNLQYSGFFAGPNAGSAGLTYKFDGGPSLGYVTGAAAFQR